MKRKEKTAESGKVKQISFRKLCFEALPEMWTYQILSTIMIIAPVVVLNLLIDWIAGLGGDAVTTANIKQFLLSWRFPVILALGALLVLVYIAFELMGQVHLTSCILSGQSSGTWRCIKAGTRSLRRFMNLHRTLPPQHDIWTSCKARSPTSTSAENVSASC